MLSLNFNMFCQEKMTFISYMGNEGPAPFIICFHSKVCNCTFCNVLAIFF